MNDFYISYKMSFQEIPIINLQEAYDANTKSDFLIKLQHALINVGFLLLTGYEIVEGGPKKQDFESIEQQSREFFNLEYKYKKQIEMINSPHFLGYTRLGNEITAAKQDWREQIDLATELPGPTPIDPIYKNIEGPNLWPDESQLPNFKPTILNYIEKMTKLSLIFKSLVAESIGLSSTAFDEFFKPNQQVKMKLVAYPEVSNETQGVGPHRDSDLLSYIYQVTDHKNSLQVQNWQGDWITVPYHPNTLVVNVGQTLEAITQGVCKATIHRVLIPELNSGTRISIPFFQTINLDSFKKVLQLPQNILDKTKERDKTIEKWGQIGFQFIPNINQDPVGVSVFKNRIKSHQDVAQRWYPEILEQVLQEY